METGRRNPRGPRQGGRGSPVSEQLTAELVAVCLASAHSYGVSRGRALGALTLAGPGAYRAPLARKLFQDTYWLGELANGWVQDRRYVERGKHPRVLPIAGPAPSFTALSRRYFGSRRVQDVIALALETGVIERSDDKVALRNPCVMLTGRPELLLARAVLCVQGLLATVENNGLKAAQRASLSPDRLACSVVTKARFEGFADHMRPRLYELAENGNRWLAKYAVRDRGARASRETRKDGHLMGVHAYVFSD